MSLMDELRARLGDLAREINVDKNNKVWIIVDLDKLKNALSLLREDGFDHLSTITGYDDGEKIHLIYHLIRFNDRNSEDVNVITFTDRDKSIAPSILDIYPSALVYEREVFDLLGVRFEGHKGLKRLLLPEDVPEDFHPLRKDFKINAER